MLSAIEYPHWLMLAGAFLVLSGLIGLAFRKKSEDAPSVKPTISLSALPTEPACSVPRTRESPPGSHAKGPDIVEG